MDHTLTKTILISKVIELIADKYKVSLDDAMDMFYKSETIKVLDDEDTGLYGDSPRYVLSIFEKEFNK